jgi:TonB family protein
MKVSRDSRTFSMSLLIGFLLGLTVVGRPQSSATEQPVVVSAAAPLFPVLANAARVSGDVFVETQIDAAGVVTSARAEGHPLLRNACEVAAKRWRFASVQKDGGNRTARLTFSFLALQEKLPDDEITPVFYPPYRVEVRKNPNILH